MKKIKPVKLKDRDPFVVNFGKFLLIFGCLISLCGIFILGIPLIFGSIFMIYCPLQCPHCKKHLKIKFKRQEFHKCKRCKKDIVIEWI